MKRVIKSSLSFGIYDNVNMSEWLPKDLELHKSIDWKARNYKDYPVPDDSFDFEAIKYSKDAEPEYKDTKFIKYLRSNPIYPPYYAPEDKNLFDNAVGPMYDGDKTGPYKIHNRYETQELYDILSN